MELGADIHCPYCGEQLWIAVDPSGGSRQRLISDCEICCRPIVLDAQVGRDGEIELRAATEDEAP